MNRSHAQRHLVSGMLQSWPAVLLLSEQVRGHDESRHGGVADFPSLCPSPGAPYTYMSADRRPIAQANKLPICVIDM